MRWAVAEGYVDPKRVCAYGASFGVYSAMMTAAKAPDLIKCVIGYAGLYDLPMMYSKGDIRTSKFGRNYLTREIGRDAPDLVANSPTALAAKIKAPVFLIHGEQDERTPIAQAKAMRAALEKAGNTPEWWSVAKEAHGFYNEDNNVERFKRVQAFLDRNIGSKSRPD